MKFFNWIVILICSALIIQSCGQKEDAQDKLADKPVKEDAAVKTKEKAQEAPKEFITWDDNTLSIGVAKVDAEHKNLCIILNKLHQAYKEKKSPEELGAILNELIQHTATHFATEEKYMKEKNYTPEAKAAHEQVHKDFVAKCLDIQKQFKENPGVLTEEILITIKDFLVQHITGMDMQLGKFLTGVGVS